MGLDITGKTTGRQISWSYGTLHFIRALALVCSGAPDFVDDNDQMSSIDFFDTPWLPEYMDLDKHKMDSFMFALQKSGHYFPNIMLHADNEGNYTPDGEVLIDNDVVTGNSTALFKELKHLLNCEECKRPELKSHVAFTQSLHDLVEDEIMNGCGTIIFS